MQGDVAGFTTYTTRRGLIVAYPAAPAKDLVSVDQSFFRARFWQATQAWRMMTTAQKAAWRTAVKRCAINIPVTALIVAAGQPKNIPIIRTIERQSNQTLLNADGSFVL